MVSTNLPAARGSNSALHEHLEEAQPNDNLIPNNHGTTTTRITAENSLLGKKSRPWQPRRHIPWQAFVALLITFASIIASGVVLYKSHHRPTDQWSKQTTPSVDLAILSALAYVCLDFALREGATIAWWTKAVRPGTLGGLHNEWAVGNSLLSAVFRPLSKLAVAKIITAVCVICGVLLQRATTIGLRERPTNGSITLRSATGLVSGFNTSTATGQGANDEQSTDVLSPWFSGVVRDHLANNSISTEIGGCSGTCTGRIPAYGLNGSCEDVGTRTVDWAEKFYDQNTTNTTLFNVWFPEFNELQNLSSEYAKLAPENLPQIVFEATFWTPQAQKFASHSGVSGSPAGSYSFCPGEYKSMRCTYFIDVVEYPVNINRTVIELDRNQTNLNNTKHIAKPTQDAWNQLAGFQTAARTLFSSSSVLTDPTITATGQQTPSYQLTWTTTLWGALASQHYFSPNTTDYPDTCSQRYTNPTTQITSSLNELLFRTSLAAGTAQPNQPTYAQTIPATETRTTLVYVSTLSFFYPAAALLLLSILCTASTFHGFWRLGRAVSLSPLETAKAIPDYLLRGEQLSNADVAALVKAVGHRECVYGEAVVNSEGEGRRGDTRRVLRFGHPNDVRGVGKGESFD